jgi:hypothetical protein
MPGHAGRALCRKLEQGSIILKFCLNWLKEQGAPGQFMIISGIQAFSLSRRAKQAGWLPVDTAQHRQRECLNAPKGAACSNHSLR